jgi:hypothetical protein
MLDRPDGKTCGGPPDDVEALTTSYYALDLTVLGRQ